MLKFQAVGAIFNMRLISAREKGLTLVEMLVTLIVVSVGVIGLLKLQSYSSYDSSVFQQKNEACLLALAQIETLRSFPVINTTSGYNSSYSGIVTSTSTVNGTSATFTVSSTVTTYTSPKYKNIVVTVSWTDKYNAAESITMATNIGSIDPAFSASVM